MPESPMTGSKTTDFTGPAPQRNIRVPRSFTRHSSHGAKASSTPSPSFLPLKKPDADYPLVLTTGRVLYHYHTGTMTRKSQGLNERAPECFVEMAKSDAENSARMPPPWSPSLLAVGKSKLRSKSPPKRSGMVFILFHFAEAAANRLTHAALDPVSKIFEFKVCAVTVSPIPSS